MSTMKVVRMNDETRAKICACLLTLRAYVKEDDKWEDKSEIYGDIEDIFNIVGFTGAIKLSILEH